MEIVKIYTLAIGDDTMEIVLGTRTAETVKMYFTKSNNETICRFLPQKAKSIDEAIMDYELTLHPEATSYGKVILVDGQYIGDIWCYCIDFDDSPNTMISYCIFETAYWNKGIATEAMRLFIKEVIEKYDFKTIGAFTFSDNISSIKVLEKNNFELVTEFVDNGVLSKYFQFEQ